MATESSPSIQNVENVDSRLTDLINAFEAHPLMQAPAESQPHPTLFFLLDFIRNTRRMLHAIDAEKLRNDDSESVAKAKDVTSRNMFTLVLVNDTTGKLALMTGGDPSNPVDFGDDIRQKAEALSNEP